MVYDNHINKHKFREPSMSSFSTDITECRIPKAHLSDGMSFAGTIRTWNSLL